MNIKSQLDRAATLARDALDRQRDAPKYEVSRDACDALAAAILATVAATKHIATLENELAQEKAARLAAEASVDAQAVYYLPASVPHEHLAEHHHDRDLER